MNTVSCSMKCPQCGSKYLPIKTDDVTWYYCEKCRKFSLPESSSGIEKENK